MLLKNSKRLKNVYILCKSNTTKDQESKHQERSLAGAGLIPSYSIAECQWQKNSNKNGKEAFRISFIQ